MKEIKMISTHTTKPSDIERKWYVVDAEGVILGRLSAEIAKILRGKNKPYFTPNLDCGDYVVVINADKVKLTGKKLSNKHYYKHTGYIGSVKDTTAGKILSGRFPERVIQKAVERMISRNPLGRQMMTKLKVYAGSEHPHTAQNPIVWDFASQNSKNKRSAL
ncbi:MAG: 50S ribosomal protein L13 [Alphaproteobacteria bacterium]|nr:50S ribosomal protein L13 [Alphaproteobacteria bacterium]